MSMEIILDTARCRPGSALSGRALLNPDTGDLGHKVELSVLWQTEGKGDTDLGVIFHQVLTDGDGPSASAEHPFETTLPLLPQSYSGRLVKVSWVVRLRRCFQLAADQIVDSEFYVGADA